MQNLSAEKIHACTGGIERAHTSEPIGKLDPANCCGPVQIGFFFDGTQNNRERDLKKYSHSNIARLYDAYPERRYSGLYKTYVPGVGTIFPEIGDTKESVEGSAFGIGCEARVIYALFRIIDQVHFYAVGRPLVGADDVREFCKAPRLFAWDSDEKKSLHDSAGGTEFLSVKVDMLKIALNSQKARRITECIVDVFGFSRGAAEARVFCSWLNKLVKNNRLAGIPIRIRFLGIFDTVASAGFWNSVGNPSSTDGHSGWAASEFLRIPDLVENCAHFIAMHELRKNFPLDQIDVAGRKSFVEVAFPGSHSDVGGGYVIGELGISAAPLDAQSDALKLSQIPLNQMIKCAIAAGVPLAKPPGLECQYEISPILKEAYDAFIRESGNSARSMRDWMQPYLNWRWQVRQTFTSTNQMTNANSEDKVLLRLCNAKLIQDAESLIEEGDVSRARKYVGKVVERKAAAEWDRFSPAREEKIKYFDKEAPLVLHEARFAPNVSPVLANFFDHFVHDSYAGFSRTLTEITGYWRYRKIFSGGSKPSF